jgi:hypothetical protein
MYIFTYIVEIGRLNKGGVSDRKKILKLLWTGFGMASFDGGLFSCIYTLSTSDIWLDMIRRVTFGWSGLIRE